MSKTMTFDDLSNAVNDGSVDTVVVVFVDMQGRLMGKRVLAQYFIDGGYEETHCCNYLLATDLEMATPDGYASTSWSSGYGDYVMKPDLSTIRRMPWVEGAAMVMCDVLDHHDHQPIPHSPRAMLKKQLERLEQLGYTCTAATELEFFLYKDTYDEARAKDYRNLIPISPYNEDYHIFQTAKEEHVMRPIRNHLHAAGIPIEGSKGEAEAGQEELNIQYSDALAMADMHSFCKHAVKEIALANGCSATFLSKLHEDTVGSSSHVHQSLRTRDGDPAFLDKDAEFGMSTVMRQFLAGQMTFVPDLTFFFAPCINSYKRFAKGSFAPTRIVWSIDNRTASFRIVSPDTEAIRIECRIGGSDTNPYLTIAGLIAAGIAGIEGSMEPPEVLAGDAYQNEEADHIPRNLRDATDALRQSTMLREAFGDEVIDHYVRAAEWEQEEFDRIVTHWEFKRGFERC